MTLVKNAYGHPYTPTVGSVMAPMEVADIGLYAQELDAINVGGLIVMDPDWVPPDEPVVPGSGSWRGVLAESVDLPEDGNTAGDAFGVIDPLGVYVWDGDSWELLFSGSSGILQYSDDTGWPERPTDSPLVVYGWKGPTFPPVGGTGFVTGVDYLIPTAAI